MSQTFNIACLDCKETYWCGQKGHGSDFYIYDAKLVAAFLYRHQGHSLIFDEVGNVYDALELAVTKDHGMVEDFESHVKEWPQLGD